MIAGVTKNLRSTSSRRLCDLLELMKAILTKKQETRGNKWLHLEQVFSILESNVGAKYVHDAR